MKPATSNKLSNIAEKLFVGLGSSIDFSRWESFSRNAKQEQIAKPDDLIYFEVNSLKEASLLCRQFIEQFELSSSNWTGGIVLDEKMEFKARISFNGKIWDNLDWTIAKEIDVC